MVLGSTVVMNFAGGDYEQFRLTGTRESYGYNHAEVQSLGGCVSGGSNNGNGGNGGYTP